MFTHAGTLQALGIPPGLIYGRPMSAGGIQVMRPPAECVSVLDLTYCLQGYVNGSAATRSVLAVASKCSKDVDCLFPEGASGRNHRWDQTVFSSLLHLAGLHTHTELRFWAKLCNAKMQEHVRNPLTAAAPLDALIMTRNRYIGIYPYAQWAADAEQQQ